MWDPFPLAPLSPEVEVVVVPSRAESLPYIVLEAAAAGRPVIATAVGGIPEIFGPDGDKLIAPGDARSLAETISAVLNDLPMAHADADRLRTRVRAGFSIEAMADQVLAAYGDALTFKKRSFLGSH